MFIQIPCLPTSRGNITFVHHWVITPLEKATSQKLLAKRIHLNALFWGSKLSLLHNQGGWMGKPQEKETQKGERRLRKDYREKNLRRTGIKVLLAWKVLWSTETKSYSEIGQHARRAEEKVWTSIKKKELGHRTDRWDVNRRREITPQNKQTSSIYWLNHWHTEA